MAMLPICTSTSPHPVPPPYPILSYPILSQDNRNAPRENTTGGRRKERQEKPLPCSLTPLPRGGRWGGKIRNPLPLPHFSLPASLCGMHPPPPTSEVRIARLRRSSSAKEVTDHGSFPPPLPPPPRFLSRGIFRRRFQCGGGTVLEASGSRMYILHTRRPRPSWRKRKCALWPFRWYPSAPDVLCSPPRAGAPPYWLAPPRAPPPPPPPPPLSLRTPLPRVEGGTRGTGLGEEEKKKAVRRVI